MIRTRRCHQEPASFELVRVRCQLLLGVRCVLLQSEQEPAERVVGVAHVPQGSHQCEDQQLISDHRLSAKLVQAGLLSQKQELVADLPFLEDLGLVNCQWCSKWKHLIVEISWAGMASSDRCSSRSHGS